MKKRNDKGFTLVELIVVLVILAILAAILVPALLGYIDKAREKQVTTNAEAAYVAAQALATEYYGKTPTGVTATNCKKYVAGDSMTDSTQIVKLTSIEEAFTVNLVMKDETDAKAKDSCIIDQFTYTQTNGEKKAIWTRTAMKLVDSTDTSYSTTTTAGGWVVLPKGDSVTLTTP